MDSLLIPTFFCPKAWAGMSGDESTRFCSYCNKHVHNLEALSVHERLALLSSPAAKLCARYKIAVRRPAPGKKESYMRHMLKYGAGVALTGSVLLVLWEVHEESNKSASYRAVANGSSTHCKMPDDLYDEDHVVTLGMMIASPDAHSEIDLPETMEPIPSIHVDLKLDPAEVEKLINQIKPPVPEKAPVLVYKKDK